MRCYQFFILLVGLVLVVCTSGCTQDPPWKRSPWRDDLAPIIKRFPMLKGVSHAKWKGGAFNESLLSVPGPTGYWMKGYVFWEDSDFENNLNGIQWEVVELDVEPGLSLSDDLINAEWKFSQSLNQKLIGNKFIGKFYFSPEKKLIYFDLFWE